MWRKFASPAVSKRSYSPKDYLSLPVCHVVGLWFFMSENNLHGHTMVSGL